MGTVMQVRGYGHVGKWVRYMGALRGYGVRHGGALDGYRRIQCLGTLRVHTCTVP